MNMARGRFLHRIQYPPIDIQWHPGSQSVIISLMKLQKIIDFDTVAHALDVINDGILITDTTKDDNPIIYCNRKFSRMTGYAREEIIGRNCRFLQGKDRDQPQIAVIRHAIAEGKKVSEILRNYRKDGSMFRNELSLSPVRDKKGDVTYYIGILKDVTKQVEEKKLYEERISYLENILRDL